MNSSPVPLKTGRVGQRCTLNMSRAKTSSRWCCMVVRRGDVRAFGDSVAKSPRAAEQCDVNNHSLARV
ncbi:uncharacterized protein TNCV_1991611 [Trichonephila clavipes]|nr:uncharacterized protein TNCV_1991611 [Trichonephila clavipes]